jgi:hypothetical protein
VYWRLIQPETSFEGALWQGRGQLSSLAGCLLLFHHKAFFFLL